MHTMRVTALTRHSPTEFLVEVVVTIPSHPDWAEGVPHLISVTDAALADRRRVYGLASDEAALRAILREHATRLGALAPSSHADAQIARYGGLRRDVQVEGDLTIPEG